jgi:hypothetical protein
MQEKNIGSWVGQRKIKLYPKKIGLAQKKLNRPIHHFFMTGMNFARMIVLIQTLRLAGSVPSWEVATVLTPSSARPNIAYHRPLKHTVSADQSGRKQMDGDVF